MKLLQEIRNYMGNYHVKSGVYHYYRNEFSQAVTFLRKALGDEPRLSEGDLKNARSYLTLSLRGLAEKLLEKGEHDEAVEALERAIEINPDYPDSHFRLAQRSTPSAVRWPVTRATSMRASDSPTV
jgi:tetratricopeptide (TPR) repeat protein